MQVLAEYYFSSVDSMIRLDMSEYMERHTVSKLIGAPPGIMPYALYSKLLTPPTHQRASFISFDQNLSVALQCYVSHALCRAAYDLLLADSTTP